jgi:hypothetical protein
VADSETGLPNDPDELRTHPFKLPRRDPDPANTCPHRRSEIIDYVRMEADPDEPSESDLQFLRAASVEGSEYWIWCLVGSDDKECYVTGSRKGRQIAVGYEVNYDGLDPGRVHARGTRLRQRSLVTPEPPLYGGHQTLDDPLKRAHRRSSSSDAPVDVGVADRADVEK